MPEFEERDLVERAKQDPEAFGALYDRYFPQIYRFAYSRVRDQSLADDELDPQPQLVALLWGEDLAHLRMGVSGDQTAAGLLVGGVPSVTG